MGSLVQALIWAGGILTCMLAVFCCSNHAMRDGLVQPESQRLIARSSHSKPHLVQPVVLQAWAVRVLQGQPWVAQGRGQVAPQRVQPWPRAMRPRQ